MGSSAAYSIARRQEGHSVVFIDTQHPIRSSWGQERAARTAYDEPLFVRMMQRAYKLWHQLESDDPADRKVLFKTNRLDVAPVGLLGTLRKVQSEMLGPDSLEMFSTPEALAARFPAIRMRPGENGAANDHTRPNCAAYMVVFSARTVQL
jgi:glycine/D-amino acid oxidase-like deaminating enzyme